MIILGANTGPYMFIISFQIKLHNSIDLEFVKVFSHDTRGGFFSSKADAANKNPNNPDADLFSILDQLEGYRGVDGNFRFKLCYPELTWGADGKKCNEWIQSSNPLTEKPIAGFKPISLAFTINSLKEPWSGLGPSQWPNSVIDDRAITFGWFAIGSTKVYYDGIAGPRYSVDAEANKFGVVKKVQLYVQNRTSTGISPPLYSLFCP